MDALEVDDFILVGADGSIMEKHRPKNQPIRCQAPKRPTKRTWSDGVVRRYGDTAILTGQITLAHETPKRTMSMGTTAARTTRGQMADGLCAVDAGSAAEWKPVAGEGQLARRSEAGAAAPGLPGPTLGRHPTRGLAIIPAQLS